MGFNHALVPYELEFRCLAIQEGIEPSHDGIKTHCVPTSPLDYCLAAPDGIDPTSPGSEPDVMPLYYEANNYFNL